MRLLRVGLGLVVLVKTGSAIPFSFDDKIPSSFDDKIPSSFDDKIPSGFDNTIPSSFEKGIPFSFGPKKPSNTEDSGNPGNVSIRAAPLPVPTGDPPMYPNPGDCPGIIGEVDASGPDMWKAANATDTLSCFKSIYKERPWFNGMGPYSTTLATYYGANQDFACSIDPLTPSGYCTLNDRCNELRPYPAMAPPPGRPPHGYGCVPRNTDLHHRSTGFVVIHSMINLNKYLTAVYELLKDAADSVFPTLGENSQFMKDFAEKQDKTDLEIAKWFSSAVFGGVSGAIGFFSVGAIPKAGVTALGAVTNAVLGFALDAAQPPPHPDIQGFFGSIMDRLKYSHKHFSDSIFRQGVVTIPAMSDVGPVNITLLELIDGGVYAGAHDYASPREAALNLMKQGLYAQLAIKTWMSSDSTPMIHLWPGDCVTDDKAPHAIFRNINMDYRDISIHLDDACYSLIGATHFEEGHCPFQDVRRECTTIKGFVGGDHKTLNGDKYAGLKLKDMITGVVNSWKSNGKVNTNDSWTATHGFTRVGFPQAVDSPGFINLPVCDYTKDMVNPGLNCPKIFMKCGDRYFFENPYSKCP